MSGHPSHDLCLTLCLQLSTPVPSPPLPSIFHLSHLHLLRCGDGEIELTDRAKWWYHFSPSLRPPPSTTHLKVRYSYSRSTTPSFTPTHCGVLSLMSWPDRGPSFAKPSRSVVCALLPLLLVRLLPCPSFKPAKAATRTMSIFSNQWLAVPTPSSCPRLDLPFNTQPCHANPPSTERHLTSSCLSEWMGGGGLHKWSMGSQSPFFLPFFPFALSVPSSLTPS